MASFSTHKFAYSFFKYYIIVTHFILNFKDGKRKEEIAMEAEEIIIGVPFRFDGNNFLYYDIVEDISIQGLKIENAYMKDIFSLFILEVM